MLDLGGFDGNLRILANGGAERIASCEGARRRGHGERRGRLPFKALPPEFSPLAHLVLSQVRVEVGSGDCLLFSGGLLPHRVCHVEPADDEQLAAANPTSLLGQMAPYVRLNMQVRVYGAGEAYGLTELLKRGYDYVR